MNIWIHPGWNDRGGGRLWGDVDERVSSDDLTTQGRDQNKAKFGDTRKRGAGAGMIHREKEEGD